VQVAIGGLFYSLVIDESDYEDRNIFSESFWNAWTFMADPGSHSEVVTSSQRIVASFITVGGIIFFAAMLGMIVDILREKMEALRQGRSKVVHSDHVLILGWNDKAIHLVHELCIANESEKGGVVVVLAPFGKEEMELELGLVLPPKQRLGTTVVFRSGSAALTSDLVKVSAHTAKAIVLLANDAAADEADAASLRCLLALNGMKHGIRGHVIAEIRDAENAPLVKLVGGSSVDTLVSHDLLGRLMAMAARQPGLSKVYEAMLGFEGDEFYIAEWPELVGLCFGDLLTRFPDAVPVGLRHRDGTIELRPNHDQVIVAGDEIVVIAEDNDTYRPEPPQECKEGDSPEEEAVEMKPERILFCGWRRHIRDILVFLDLVVEPGSEVHMMTHCVPLKHRSARLMEEGLDVTKLKNLTIVHHVGNTSVRRKLEDLPMGTFTSAMIFADQDYEKDPMHSDSHSLATLLLCRDIQVHHSTIASESATNSRGLGGKQAKEWSVATSTRSGRYPPNLQKTEEEAIKLKDSFPVVCEILDPRTQRIITGNKQVALASDFCQTNKLVAQIMSMIAEERSVKKLLEELWGVHGASIDVVPVGRYIRPGESVSFWQLSKRAMIHFREIIIGYQVRHSPEATVLNPKDKNKPMGWKGCDIAIIRAAQTAVNPFEAQGEFHELVNSLQSEKHIRESAREISDAVEQELRPASRSSSAGMTEPPARRESGLMRLLSRLGWDQSAQKEEQAVPDDTPDSASQKTAKVKEIMSGLKTLRAQMSDKEWVRVELSLAVLSQVLNASHQISKI